MADTSNDAALAAELQAQADVETPLIAQPAPPVVIAGRPRSTRARLRVRLPPVVVVEQPPPGIYVVEDHGPPGLWHHRRPPPGFSSSAFLTAILTSIVLLIYREEKHHHRSAVIEGRGPQRSQGRVEGRRGVEAQVLGDEEQGQGAAVGEGEARRVDRRAGDEERDGEQMENLPPLTFAADAAAAATPAARAAAQ
ncbi:hypothetical protein JL721_9851 [Aureococcus anophagefferens]|nr:hypothetical protein JL721_9851 [Aureococcus anophagefferens]